MKGNLQYFFIFHQSVVQAGRHDLVWRPEGPAMFYLLQEGRAMREKNAVVTVSIVAACLVIAALGISSAQAQIFTQPPPGSVYREFSMTVSLGGEWIVASQLAENNFPDAVDYPNPLNYINISGGALSGAVRAEALMTVWGGHVGTTGKKISFNSNANLSIPELQTAPGNGECFLQQENIVINVPVGHLVEGSNYFQADCETQSCYSFGWPQWGLYGLILRVYYDPNSISHVSGSITSPSSSSSFGDGPVVTASVSGSADRVDFLAYYDGYDTDGDGIWQEYHHDYNMPKWADMGIQNHVGTAWSSPWSVVWDNTWVPDQSGMKILARIHGTNGVWYVTQPVENLSLARSQSSVVMFKPTNVGPREWAKFDVDDGEHGYGYQVQNVYVNESADISSAAALVRTWHGADIEVPAHWVKFNNYTFPAFGDPYFAKLDLLEVPTWAVAAGNNDFTFYSPEPPDGNNHHGIEILWPGPALLVRYGVPLPIQLASFTAGAVTASSVELKWSTLSEVDNYGFYVQRAYDKAENFATILGSFKEGRGTTNETTYYSYVDADAGSSVRYYRLQQIDKTGGRTTYSDPLKVDLSTLMSVNENATPTSYALSQAYPNPFNPSTIIKYALPEAGSVRVHVMNQIGQTVRVLTDGMQGAGYHQVTFDAAGLASGVYFYQIKAGKFVDTKKVVLIR
jgi:hypothetical protein